MRNFQNGLCLPRELRVKSVIGPTVVHDQLYITQELSAAMILVSCKRNSLVTSKYLYHTNMSVCEDFLQIFATPGLLRVSNTKKIKEIDVTVKLHSKW